MALQDEIDVLEQEKIGLQRQVLNVQRRWMDAVSEAKDLGERVRSLEDGQKTKIIMQDSSQANKQRESVIGRSAGEWRRSEALDTDDENEATVDEHEDMETVSKLVEDSTAVVEIDSTGHKRLSKRLSVKLNLPPIVEDGIQNPPSPKKTKSSVKSSTRESTDGIEYVKVRLISFSIIIMFRLNLISAFTMTM